MSAARFVSVLVLLAVACTRGEPPPSPTPPPPPTPAATATPTPPSAEQTADAFFERWQQGQFSAMYDMISDEARQVTSRDVFVRRYTGIRDGIGEASVEARPVAATMFQTSATGVPGARIPFESRRMVAVFGEIVDHGDLVLALERGAWRVAWNPGLIFSGLTASSSVRVSYTAARRGRILDRNGEVLAEDGSILSVGVTPGQVTDEPRLLSALSEALDLEPATIKRRYQDGQPDWFMPIADRVTGERDALEAALGEIPGVVLRGKTARTYPLGEHAAHLTGYVAHPTADELRRLGNAGYEQTDWIGRAGVEAWADDDLAGHKGGRLSIVDQQGRQVRPIAERTASAGADVQLAIDARVQRQVSNSLGQRVGSAVVMDPRSGSVLALASHPTFDPNAFVVGLSDDEWQRLSGESRALVLRATESAYATGSTFKVITMAAGLERGGYRTADRFDCAYDWNGLPGVTLHNWKPQGMLDMVEALSQSCNPAFYSIGLKLDREDSGILPSIARGFGLGQPTGIVGVTESSGVVPDPEWKRARIGQPWTAGDAVNLAIGQGYLLATPLQVANAYAALANGGTLRAPLLVTGVGERAFEAQERGSLPISPQTRAAIVEGMRRVTSTANGTAFYAFRGESVPTAAKTGSAENEHPEAHAWFAGFKPVERPVMVALVMIEGGEHGSTVAAPVAREILDAAYPMLR